MSGLTLPGVRVSPRDPTDGCTVQPDSTGSPSPPRAPLAGVGESCTVQLVMMVRRAWSCTVQLTADAIPGIGNGRRNARELPAPLQLAEWSQGLAQVAPCNSRWW